MKCSVIILFVAFWMKQYRGSLLAENKPMLMRATEIALLMETAAKDASNLRITVTLKVNKIQLQRNRGITAEQEKLQETSLKSTGNCICCDDRNHQSRECRFKNSTCHSCGKIIHITKICQSKLKIKKDVKVHNL